MYPSRVRSGWQGVAAIPLPCILLASACSASSGSPLDAFDAAPSVTSPVSPADAGMLSQASSAPTPANIGAACSTTEACESRPCSSVACVTSGGGEFTSSVCVYTPVDSGSCGPTIDAGVDESMAVAPSPPPQSPLDSGPGDAGAPPMDAGGVGLAPIDPLCASGTASCGSQSVFPPFVPLVEPDAPADCESGFEVADVAGDAEDVSGAGIVYTLATNRAGGAAAVTLGVDFATYMVPDGVVITGVDAAGATYTLLDTCRIQTYVGSEPTDGRARPLDETIRQFQIAVKAGTMSLTVDFGGVCSPMYLQIRGLCDFDVTPFASQGWWQAVQ